MTYKKAEIRVLGDAGVVIQDLTKPIEQVVDSRTHQFGTQANPAYDLDE